MGIFDPLVIASSIFMGAIALGTGLDSWINETGKAPIRKRIDQVVHISENWFSIFLTIFDRLFNKGDTRRISFLKFSMVSILLFAIIFLIRATYDWDAYIEFLVEAVTMESAGATVSLFAVFFINIAFDYFSILETRWIISRISLLQEDGIYSKSTKLIGTLFLLLLDCVFTLLVFLIGYFISSFFFCLHYDYQNCTVFFSHRKICRHI